MTPLSPTEFKLLHEVMMDGPITARQLERVVKMPWGWKVRNVLQSLRDAGFVELAPVHQILQWARKSGARVVLKENEVSVMQPEMEIVEHSQDADYQGIEDQITLHAEALYNFLHGKCRETWDVTPAGAMALRVTRIKQGLK